LAKLENHNMRSHSSHKRLIRRHNRTPLGPLHPANNNRLRPNHSQRFQHPNNLNMNLNLKIPVISKESSTEKSHLTAQLSNSIPNPIVISTTDREEKSHSNSVVISKESSTEKSTVQIRNHN
jgi:hypothetical protein